MSFSISIIISFITFPLFTSLPFYFFTLLSIYVFTSLPFYFFTFPYFTADNLAIISIIAAWLSSVRSPFFPRAS